MKKPGDLVLIVMVAIMFVLMALGLPGCTKNATENTEAKIEKIETEEKLYSIEQLASGWMIVLVKKDYNWGDHATERLAEGVKELGKNYEIISMVPAEDYYYRGGVTRAFVVKVEPKY